MRNTFVSKRGFKSILMKLKELSLGPSGIVISAIRVHSMMDSIFIKGSIGFESFKH